MNSNKLEIAKGYVLPNKTNYINFINDDSANGFIDNFKTYEKWLRASSGPKWQKDLKIYQLLVSNYLQENTPYRGLLLYHGLGAGKTAASITIAEGYINRKVMVFLPASIKTTFISEVDKFSIISNTKDYFWVFRDKDPDGNDLISYTKYNEDATYKDEIIKYFRNDCGVDIASLDAEQFRNLIYTKDGEEYIGVWVTDMEKPVPNYDTLEDHEQTRITKQTKDRINVKYDYYSYNGSAFLKDIIEDNMEVITKANAKDMDNDIKRFKTLLNLRDPDTNKKMKRTEAQENTFRDLLFSMNNPFDNKTIIIDEVHNFISLIRNGSKNASIVYLLLMKAQNIRLVFLSATPAINEPFELSILINLLNGYTNEYTLRFTFDNDTDIDDVRDIIDKEKTIDRYETLIKVNNNTISVSIVRNEKGFGKVRSDNYPNFPFKIHNLAKSTEPLDCVHNTCDNALYLEYLKGKLKAETVTFQHNTYSVFPDIVEKNKKRFIINKQSIENATTSFNTNYVKLINNELIINNERDFIKRSLGSISYFEGIDIEALRARGEEIGYPSKKEYMLPSNLSAEQYGVYKLARDEEIQKDNKKRLMINQDIPSTFRSATRQAVLCTYPPDTMEIRNDLKTMDKKSQKQDMRDIYNKIIGSIAIADIAKYSPKYQNLMTILSTSPGPALIYSSYYNYEGLVSLARYMELDGYSIITQTQTIEEFDNSITQFREKKDDLQDEMVIFNELYSVNEEEIKELRKEMATSEEDIVRLQLQKKIDMLSNWLRGKITTYREDSDTVVVQYTTCEISDDMEIHTYKYGDAPGYTYSTNTVEINLDAIYPATVVLLHGGVKNRDRDNYISVFNDLRNKYGQYISGILATDVIAEGINLSYIRQINILNPSWNKVKTNQVIGRGTRMKSHIALLDHQKNLNVFHHLMEFTKEQIQYQVENRELVIDKTLTTDQYLYDVGVKKENLVNQFLKILKEVSIDCQFSQSGDFMKKDPNINCISRVNEKVYGFRYNIFSSNLNNQITDSNQDYLGMPTKKTFPNYALNKYHLTADHSFHIFNDSQYYYNFYKFIFNSSFILQKHDIIKLDKIGFMKADMNITDLIVPEYELKLWTWLDTILVQTIEKLAELEETAGAERAAAAEAEAGAAEAVVATEAGAEAEGSLEEAAEALEEAGEQQRQQHVNNMKDYVYKLLVNFNNPMINDHICRALKLNVIKNPDQDQVPDSSECGQQGDDNTLCNKIKYEVIGRVYELIDNKLRDTLIQFEDDSIDKVISLLEKYRETAVYYEILLKLFKNNYDSVCESELESTP